MIELNREALYLVSVSRPATGDGATKMKCHCDASLLFIWKWVQKSLIPLLLLAPVAFGASTREKVWPW
jgi:hypothetical protein